MPLRQTIIGAVMILVMCAAIFFGVTNYFGRGIGERGNDFPLLEGRVNGPEPSRQMDMDARDPQMAEKPVGRVEGGRVTELLEEGTSAQQPQTDLDSWYADAGSNNGPADTTPVDNSFLINSTEPYTTTDPL